MHAGRKYTIKEVFLWTRRETLLFLLVAAVPTILYEVIGWKWLTVPWLPIALVGTAVAFLVGFKNNATYDRLWEARKIWGAIVNTSRSWGILVKDYVTNRHAKIKLESGELKQLHRTLIYRHIAWLTALRYQLRQPKVWENMGRKHNVEYRRAYSLPEEEMPMEEALKPFLNSDELNFILQKKNKATQLISLQSDQLKQLLEGGYIEDFRHMELESLLVDLYTQQGKCERIKNFPYPRQFATINHYFIWIFILLLPFGMLEEFEKFGDNFVWLTIPFSALVAWIFHTMDKIGEATENPFEGSANDIPMTALSRTIEIDLREMLDEKDLPEPITPQRNILF